MTCSGHRFISVCHFIERSNVSLGRSLAAHLWENGTPLNAAKSSRSFRRNDMPKDSHREPQSFTIWPRTHIVLLLRITVKKNI